MPFGYNSKILRINLQDEKISIENLDDIFYRRYLGGEGFVAYYLLKELEVGIDPLGPENKLIFACGPVTGTPIPGNGRNSVGAKSPLTNGFGEAEVGGHWGAELKHAGFDAIIFEKKATSPVYLWVHDGKSEIKDASHLWGKETGETEEKIREELGDKLVRVASIGIGGENLVRYACVMNDLHDAAGRTGMGAVMGSKNLKAIAVRGKRKLDLSKKDTLVELSRWLSENMQNVAGNLHNYGTGVGLDSGLETGNLPVRNFRDGDFPNPDALDAMTIKKTISIDMDACYGCSVRCKKVVKIGEPWNVEPKYGGPEYENLIALGSDCGIDNLNAVTKANEICNRNSIDGISAGASIAFAMECYEKGLLTKKDTDGIELTWGNAEAMLEMVKRISQRKGFGNILAEGVKRAAEKIGRDAEDFAVHVKGQELPMHEPRLKRALGLGYAVSPTGADHMHNLHDTDPVDLERLSALGIIEPPPLEDLSAKKVKALVYFVDWRVVNNSLLICDFLPWDYIQKTMIVRAVTGWNTTTWELMKTGERITTMARIFNIREGFKKEDDWLPKRFFNPKTSGALSETAVSPVKLKEARKIYYSMLGWDEEGIPTKTCLEELDIDWISEIMR